MRQIIVIAGVSFWLGSMLVKTGGSSVIALATAVLFVAELIILGSATRTVTLRLLAWLFLMGGAMMGVGYLGRLVVPDYPAKAFVIPLNGRDTEARSCLVDFMAGTKGAYVVHRRY